MRNEGRRNPLYAIGCPIAEMRLAMKRQALQRFSDGITAHLSSTAAADASTYCLTKDIDEIESVFYPESIDLIGEQNTVSPAEMYAVRLNYLTIGLTRFGQDVSVDVGDLDY